MICPKCGNKIPEDSEFCQYCGFKMKKEDEYLKNDEVKLKSQTKSKNDIYNSYSSDTQEGNNKFSMQKESHKKWIVLSIYLIVLLLASVGINVFQYLSNRSDKDKVVELSNSVQVLSSVVADKNEAISKQGTEIMSLKADISSLRTKVSAIDVYSKRYTAIVDAVKQGNLGYASNSFKVSDSIIIVKKGETNKKFTLTASWSNGGTVEVDYSPTSPSAYVSFDKDSWSTSTTMTIKPKYSGVTTVTFSNDVNNQVFNMIIIVE